MYNSNNFNNDIELLKGNPPTISALDLPPPEDNYYLLYRYQFVTLLFYFKANNHEKVRMLANQYLPSIIDYIQNFDYGDIITFQELNSPPFDFIMLTFMCSNNKPNHYLYIMLYNHYLSELNIIKSIKEKNGNMLLSDLIKRENFQVSLRKGFEIIKKRLNFIIEIMISYLYNNGLRDMMITFMEDFCTPDDIKDEKTLSFLYRISFGICEFELADKYLSLIKNNNLNMANEGYKHFLEHEFTEAMNCFQNAGNATPENYLASCRKYMCDLVEDPTVTKTLTNEEKTQWPLPPQP